MDAIELAEAQAHLSDLLDRVEAGETIAIARHGRAIVRLTAIAAPRKQVDLAMLQALTATLPSQTQDAGALVRSMRDDERT